MSDEQSWVDVGAVADFADGVVAEIRVNGTRVAVSRRGEVFGAVSGVCNHVGGPLGQGRLDGEYLVCPWHQWKFHRCEGVGEPGYEADRVPKFAIRAEAGRVLVGTRPLSRRGHLPHPPHPLAREPRREPGALRVAGLSTTVMDGANPRYSTSEALLDTALAHAGSALGAETRLIRLRDLSFRHCEGYYSKSAKACTWPCSITQMDSTDQLDRVYEAVVHWADVLLIATPIRWGAASSLYYKMAERMNCVQNQVTVANRVLIRNKVAGFVITGGQDNVQAVAGQMLGFFAELGFVFPPFPYVAHSLGWTAENMERNVAWVQTHAELHAGARALVERAATLAGTLTGTAVCAAAIERGGRKAHGPAEA